MQVQEMQSQFQSLKVRNITPIVFHFDVADPAGIWAHADLALGFIVDPDSDLVGR